MMIIETISLEKLIEDPNNARKHPDKNITAIMGSLTRFGQQKPLVIDEDNIVIAGNGTLEAAKRLNWTEIQVVRSGLKGFDAAAFALADNRTAELAEWNRDILNSTLMALEDLDFGIDQIGFSIDEFEGSLKDAPDEFKEFNEDETTKYRCPKCSYEWR